MEIQTFITILFFTNVFAELSHEELIQTINLGHYVPDIIMEYRAEDCEGSRRLTCYNETALSFCSSRGRRIIPCHGFTQTCNPVLNICVPGRTNIVSKFMCPGEDGYYPDFSSCRKYYFCAKGKAKEYKCDITDVYDPKTKSCVQVLRNRCFRFQCIGKQGIFTPYPGEPNIYALCSGNQPVEIFRCPEGLGMNEGKQKCEAHCEKEGLIKNITSCVKYNECTRTITGFKVRSGECPPGAWFDPKFSHCRMLQNEKDCPEAVIQESTTQDNVTDISEEPTEPTTESDEDSSSEEK